MSGSSPPPSHPPGIPKKSGSGLVLLGVLFLLLGGGAVAYKVLAGGSSETVAEETVTTVKTAEPPAPILNHAAPPPPSEEEVAAADTASAPSSSGTPGAKGPVGCSGKCAGTPSAEMLSALKARGSQASGCYKAALRLNENLGGKLTVATRIGPTGAVCSASIASDTLNNSAVTACVLQIFRSEKFPPPTGGCVETQVPINFTSK